MPELAGPTRVRVYRNEDVKRVIAFIPRGHKHVRVAVETADSLFVFQEATVDAVVRAYVDVVTHPTKRATELALAELEERKEGYARHQHLETGRAEGEILDELEALLGAVAGR